MKSLPVPSPALAILVGLSRLVTSGCNETFWAREVVGKSKATTKHATIHKRFFVNIFHSPIVNIIKVYGKNRKIFITFFES